jgi:hypothetical protein
MQPPSASKNSDTAQTKEFAMADICSAASSRQLKAVFVNNLLVLAARGMKATPCHRVAFEKSPLDVEPPHFLLRSCVPSGTICPQVLAPYRIVNVFEIGIFRPHVIVEDAAGKHRVPVQVVDDAAAFDKIGSAALIDAPANYSPGPSSEDATRDRGDIPWPFEGKALRMNSLFANRLETASIKPKKATGFSDDFSFAQAFQEAIANLPEDPNVFPDELTSIRVVAIGAHIGGIAGLRRMFVTITAS